MRSTRRLCQEGSLAAACPAIAVARQRTPSTAHAPSQMSRTPEITHKWPDEIANKPCYGVQAQTQQQRATQQRESTSYPTLNCRLVFHLCGITCTTKTRHDPGEVVCLHSVVHEAITAYRVSCQGLPGKLVDISIGAPACADNLSHLLLDLPGLVNSDPVN